MKTTRRNILAALLCAGSTGCTSAPASTPDASVATGVVPPDLRDVERDGEGLVTTTFGASPMHMADWGRARSVLGLLRAAWTRATAMTPGLPAVQVRMVTQAITALDAAITAQDQRAAVVAANQVGLACPELYDYFRPDAPLQIIRMDAVFRQVGIDARFGDWTAVTRDVASLHADWTAARASIHGRVPTCHRVAGTATVEGDVEASLTHLDMIVAARDQAGADAESDNGALEVDTLELLYDCPPDGPAPAHGLGSRCDSTTTCGAGLTCETSIGGGRCAPDPALARVGTPCSSTPECGTDPRSACNTAAGDNFPGGYCFMEPCDDVQLCPAGSTCVALGGEATGCFKSCATDSDCRVADGYVCQRFVTTPPSGYGPSDHACAFRCTRDSDCGMPLRCDIASGKCTP